MYTILTTMKTGNVGDQLIIESAKNIIRYVKGKIDFLEFFRGEDLTSHLGEINKTKAIIMPHFGLRDPMYPNNYRLTKDLNEITIPLIPIGIGWKGIPGDFETLDSLKYSDATVNFLRSISNQVDAMLCREYYTCKVLENHGIKNTVMGGDCAWYDINSLNKSMKRPRRIDSLVFTSPANPIFLNQAKTMLKMLSDIFPQAKKYCSFHHGLEYITSDKELADFAQKEGFEIKDVSHDINKISFYDDCDLHVGYRCHGHIAFLRKRIPSILLHEDGRGVGFSYSFGVGGFNAFRRNPNWKGSFKKIIGKVEDNTIIVDENVPQKIKQMITEELESGFRRYVGLSNRIDETFEKVMKPFVEAIP